MILTMEEHRTTRKRERSSQRGSPKDPCPSVSIRGRSSGLFAGFRSMLARGGVRFLVPWAAMAALAATAVAQPRRVSLLITNCIVITEYPARPVIHQGSVPIDGRDIVAVDRAETIARAYTSADTIDASGSVVLPGLI